MRRWKSFLDYSEGISKIFESESEGITTYHNGAWHNYFYLGDDLFQDRRKTLIYIWPLKEIKKAKFSPSTRSVNIGGVQIPASFRKLGFFERPRFLNDEYPYALVILVTYLFMPLFWLGRNLIGRKRLSFLPNDKIGFYYHAVAFLFLLLFFWNIFGFFVPLIKMGEQVALGLPDALLNMKYVNWVMGLCSIALFILSLQLWIKKESSLWFRVYYTIFSLISLSYILLLHRWHFFYDKYVIRIKG